MSVDEKIIVETILELLSEMTGIEWKSSNDTVWSSALNVHVAATAKNGPAPTGSARRIVVCNVRRGTYDSITQWRSCLALELKLALAKIVDKDTAAHLQSYHAGPAQVAAEEAEWAATRYKSNQ
jgi:hypothetical protein